MIKKRMSAIIEGVLYDIFYLDKSADRTELFLGMEEVRRLAE